MIENIPSEVFPLSTWPRTPTLKFNSFVEAILSHIFKFNLFNFSLTLISALQNKPFIDRLIEGARTVATRRLLLQSMTK